VLGLQRNPSPKEIRAAYLRLVLKLHPDKTGANKTDETDDAYRLVQGAYEKLTNA